MIKIVIVDDDALALTKLKEIIHIRNTKIAGEFTQAADALEFIRNHPADILVTDMKMPKIDGIDLIRQAKQYVPGLEVIAISSYKDFHYVKESFREGSVDYILKHMLDEESMTNALLEAISRIRRSGGEMPGEDVMEDSQNALKEKVFSQMLRGEIPAEKAGESFQKYKIPVDFGSTVLILCEIDDYPKISEDFQQEDRRIFLNAVCNLIERVTAKVPERIMISVKEGCYAVILSYVDVKSQLYIYSRSTQYARQINENIKKMMNVDVSVSLGTLCMSIRDILQSYEECRAVLAGKLFEGKGKVYNNYNQDLMQKQEKVSGQTVKPEGSKLYQKLASADRSCLADVEDIFDGYKEGKVPQMVIDLGIVEMLNAAYKVAEENRLEYVKEQENFHVMYHRVKRLETLDEMKEVMRAFYRKICGGVSKAQKMKESGYSKYTAEAVQYLKNHYRDAMSLQQLAEHMGIHYAYLSKRFKQDTGVNFGEYLNRIRIEKAKELIQTGNYRIKEVYADVGFNQYNYFFKVFKQVEGCTPVEFEKKIKNV